MPLYGQFGRQSEDQRNDETWTCLKESLILAAQDQAIRTNYVKAAIDRSQEDSKCRMCKQSNETISQIVSGCPILAQKEYKKRNDNVARAVHWDRSEKYGFERSERWYNHVPDSVLENEDYKMRWDFSVRTSRLGDRIY